MTRRNTAARIALMGESKSAISCNDPMLLDTFTMRP